MPQQFVHAALRFLAGDLATLVFVGIEAGDVELEPVGMLEEKRLLRVHLGLHLKVTDLAERQQIPPGIVALVAVEVVHRQDAAGNRRAVAPDTLVADGLAGGAANLFAVVGVLAREASHVRGPPVRSTNFARWHTGPVSYTHLTLPT